MESGRDERRWGGEWRRRGGTEGEEERRRGEEASLGGRGEGGGALHPAHPSTEAKERGRRLGGVA